ncbi:putative GABA permease [Pseudovirgaria hyperparasitica]|uniref:Putative GABA permease n=1 Tax=Pseudovirgaria hyperparasitica TaxID=470096 RepID=A0A6A6W8L2_9PEZI|nr:putative GABA permease [Pseudovirgaria hyperparasitica]KAF2759192.1 putative GABA permease [Pseudovirgaria hyperparasitica]
MVSFASMTNRYLAETKNEFALESRTLTDNDGLAADANGTIQDGKDMARLGKKQQFQRNFRFISILGFTCTLMCTWECLVASASLALINGGLAGFVWTCFGTTFCYTAVIASMADMASMMPTTGGQYHWVSEFAPKSKQKFMSYMAGWTASLGWQAGLASTAFLSATMIQGLVVLNYPTYEAQRWHATLIFIAVLSVCIFFNTIGARHLPLIEGLILMLHIMGFFAVVIPLWVLAPKISAKEVFTSFSNTGGWSSVGSACMVGQLASVYSFLGPDAAVHMAEEIRDASKIVPRAMITTVLVNGLLGFVMVITFCFCITDLPAALDSRTGFPFIEVFHAATDSKAGATAMVSIFIALLMCCAIGNLATASRQFFAFARDDGMPGAHIWSRVTTVGVAIPLHAILISMTISIAIALINIGSTAAFNSVVSLVTAADFSTYFLSIICILTKRLRGEPLLPSRWSMGKWAIPVNIFACAYLIFGMVMSFFPTSRIGLSPEGMNWSVLVYTVVVAGAAVLYLVHGRYTYRGPVVNVRRVE